MSKLIGEVAPDEIYNLAAQSHVANSFENPIATFDANVNVILHICDAVLKQKLERTRVFHVSSSEMFGNAV